MSNKISRCVANHLNHPPESSQQENIALQDSHGKLLTVLMKNQAFNLFSQLC